MRLALPMLKKNKILSISIYFVLLPHLYIITILKLLFMQETLKRDLVALATEIIVNEENLPLDELKKKARSITEKITILSFIEKYYQTLGGTEERLQHTIQKVTSFMDKHQDQDDDIFNIAVETTPVAPIQFKQEENVTEKSSFVAMEPAPIQKKETTPVAKEEVAIEKEVTIPIHKVEPMRTSVSEPTYEWAMPTNKTKEENSVPVPPAEPVSEPIDFAIEQPQMVSQAQFTDEERILKQTPSLEEFISKSKNTVFDKKDVSEEIKPAQSLNDKLGKNVQIGLNDKLAFVQKLFFGSESEYNKVIKHVAELPTMQQAALYIEQEVKPTYNYWKGKEEYEERFLSLLLKRFEV